MYYVLDENKNLVEALDKEGVEALLARAIQEGQLPSVDEDTAFVTMLKDPITGVSHKIIMCSQAKFNEMKEADQLIHNAYYHITDDTTADDLEAHLVRNDERVEALEGQVNENTAKLRVYSISGEQDSLLDLLNKAFQYYLSAEYAGEKEIVGFFDDEESGENGFVSITNMATANNNRLYFCDFNFVYEPKEGHAERNTAGYWEITYSSQPQSIDPTSDITQTGLYAVSYRIGLDQGAVTWMLSVFTLEDGTRSFDIEGTSFSVSQGVFTANFSYSTKKITIMCKKDGNTTFLEPSDIHLIAKY